MATTEARAVELKDKGNKAFKEHDWDSAIDFYTQAIEANGKEPTFYTNRAQVRKLSCGAREGNPLTKMSCEGSNKGRSIWFSDCRCYQGH